MPEQPQFADGLWANLEALDQSATNTLGEMRDRKGGA